MDSSDDQSCRSSSELLPLDVRGLFLPFLPQPTAAGNCINSAHCPTGTVRYVCQGHHGTFLSYAAPKSILWDTMESKTDKKKGLPTVGLS